MPKQEGRMIGIKPNVPAPRPARDPLRIDGAIPDGSRAVSMVRAGVELLHGLSIAGDQIALPADQASKLVKNGAAEYLGVES
jgi:hypothetical protein